MTIGPTLIIYFVYQNMLLISSDMDWKFKTRFYSYYPPFVLNKKAKFAEPQHVFIEGGLDVLNIVLKIDEIIKVAAQRTHTVFVCSEIAWIPTDFFCFARDLRSRTKQKKSLSSVSTVTLFFFTFDLKLTVSFMTTVTTNGWPFLIFTPKYQTNGYFYDDR